MKKQYSSSLFSGLMKINMHHKTRWPILPKLTAFKEL